MNPAAPPQDPILQRSNSLESTKPNLDPAEDALGLPIQPGLWNHWRVYCGDVGVFWTQRRNYCIADQKAMNMHYIRRKSTEVRNQSAADCATVAPSRRQYREPR